MSGTKSWRKLLEQWTDKCEFSSPASDEMLSSTEKSLGVALPEELRDVLTESNGILGEYGLGLIWNTERIKKDNLAFRLEYRDIYMPFDSLLFFADAGNGDQFAFAVLNGMVRKSNIFAWNHEDDSRNWVAPSLEEYLQGWLTGNIKL